MVESIIDLIFSKDIKAWKAFFETYRDRILFGSDANPRKNFNRELYELVYTALTHDHSEFALPCYSGASVRGLALDEDVVDRICYLSYTDFVLPEIAPVNTALMYEKAQEMLSYLYTNPIDPYYIAGGEMFADLKADAHQDTEKNL